MAKNRKQASKADVQSTELNKLPAPGVADTEFSAEDAAQAFKGKSSGKSRKM